MSSSSIGSINSAGSFATSSTALPARQSAERRQVSQAAKAVNASGVLGRNQLILSIDSQTHRPIIRIEDRETHELVQQIPPEYVLQLAENLGGGSTKTIPPAADT
jgi:uncharacterized FlaG/YvyC family protein